MSKKLFGGKKKAAPAAAAAATPESKGPILKALSILDPLAERIKRRRGQARSTIVGSGLSSTLGG